MAAIELDRISKVYPDGTAAVSDLSLEIADGEFMVLVGPSGCGKTTALRMVAGLEDVTAGAIRIGDRDVTRISSKDRDIAMVFQNYALYPHLSVRDNMGFSLALRKVKKAEVRRRVTEAAQLLGIEAYLDRKPRQLSGGQRQRVAMGRAIVREPQAFLMDEPLSNLDAKLRVQMRAEVARIQQRLEVTTIYVTHDQTEAMTMGDRVAVMKRGVLQQVATPAELYEHPVNVFVGGFIGSPAMNLIEAQLRRDGGRPGDDGPGDDGPGDEGPGDEGWSVEFGRHRLALPADFVASRPALGGYEGRKLVLGIRPESMEDAALAPDVPDDRLVDATVDLVERTGADAYLHFVLDAPTVLTDDTRDLIEAAGSEVGRFEEPTGLDVTECVARVSPHTAAAERQPVRLVVDTSQLQLFDVDTGLAIRTGETPSGGTAHGTGGSGAGHEQPALEEVR
jgi:multiple sugar transport system ATP-binding protein